MSGQRLRGKRVLITAAGQGIGRASAIAMSKEGAQVFATDVNMKTLSTIRDLNLENIEIFELNVRNSDSILDGVAKAKPDVLFNCAGFVHHGAILDATDDEWDFAFNLNVRAMFIATQAALPHMLENGGGSIINMSSQLGRVGAPIRSVYNMTKFGLEGLTRGMALELSNSNIRVNSVCPTFVETPMVKAFFKNKKFKKEVFENIPLGRIAQENDVSTAVAFLAADSSNSITGTSLMVDGGWTAK